MNHSLKTCLLFILILLIGTLPLYAAAPSEVQKAAQSGLDHFRSTVPAQEMARMGLVTAEEVTAAVLGNPWNEYVILPASLQAYKSGMSISSLLTGTDNWIYPVLVNGQARTMMEVSLQNGNWEATTFGGTFLPQRLQEVQGRMGTLLGQKGISRQSAVTLRFVRVYQAQSEFMAVLGGNTEYLLPLMPNPSRMNIAADTLLAADQVIPQLKQEVQNSIEQWNVQKRKTR
jgi:hypothetical protein